MVHSFRTRLFILFTCLLTLTTASAQKRQMAEAEGYLRSGKNYDKAELLMTKLLRSSQTTLTLSMILLPLRSQRHLLTLCPTRKTLQSTTSPLSRLSELYTTTLPTSIRLSLTMRLTKSSPTPRTLSKRFRKTSQLLRLLRI